MKKEIETLIKSSLNMIHPKQKFEITNMCNGCEYNIAFCKQCQNETFLNKYNYE